MTDRLILDNKPTIEIDFKKAKEALANIRKESLDYLTNALIGDIKE